MGWNTAWTVKALEKAKKAGDRQEVARLAAIIDGVQGRCGHGGPKQVKILDRDSNRRKYRAGGRVTFCLLCSKITGYETPEEVANEG